MTAPMQDPFAGGDSRPSVSWKTSTVGDVVTVEVDDHPVLTQGRDFKTKEPAVWSDGNPKLIVGIPGLVNGEPMMLWANKPSALFGAIKDAIKGSGESGPIKPGDTLAVRFSGTKPTAGDPQKLFEAKLTRGVAPAKTADPFGEASAPNPNDPPW